MPRRAAVALLLASTFAACGSSKYEAGCKEQATQSGYGTEVYNEDEWEREWKRCVESTKKLADQLGE